MEIGKKVWAIAEGYIPKTSTGEGRELESHETVCILNTTNNPAHVEIMIYYSDREPQGPHHFTVGPRRTMHIRFNDLQVPKGTDYSSTIISDIPIVAQHTRLDSRQAANALMSSIAYNQ